MENNLTPKQALEELEEKAKLLICNDGYVCDLAKTIYQALTDYEKQKKTINELCDFLGLDNLFPYDNFEKISQEIKNLINEIKTQKNDLLCSNHKKAKILEVLKTKKVDIFLVSITDCVEEYNELLGGYRKNYLLTETEFNLIKEWLK